MTAKLLKRSMAILACGLMSFLPVHADDLKSAVVVWYDEQELYSFYVSDNPVMKVSEDYALIQSDGEWQEEVNLEMVTITCYYYIPLSETKKYRVTLEKRDYYGYFGNEATTGIGEVRPTGTRPAFSLNQGVLQVAGLKPGASVIVATTDGKALAQQVADSHGKASLSLRGQRGIVVVKAGNVSFKVKVK